MSPGSIAALKTLSQIFENMLSRFCDHMAERTSRVNNLCARKTIGELQIDAPLRESFFQGHFLFPRKEDLSGPIQYEHEIRLWYQPTYKSHQPRGAAETIPFRVGKQIGIVAVEHH